MGAIANDAAGNAARAGAAARGSAHAAPPSQGPLKTQPPAEPEPSAAAAPQELEAALERICFDEWRLEQQAVALADKERVIQEQRLESASATNRAVADARRIAELEFELAQARAEIVTLGDRCAQAVELCGELEQRLAAAARRMVEVEAAMQRERESRRELQAALQRNRERTAVLERGRERFFARLVEWQSQSSGSNPHQIDLAQFIAELRAEIASLSAENQVLQERARRAAERAPALSPSDVQPLEFAPRPADSPLAAVSPAQSEHGAAASRSAPAPGATSRRRLPVYETPAAPPLVRAAAAEPALPGRLSTVPASALERSEIEAALLARFPAEPKRRYVQRLLTELFGSAGTLRARAAGALVELAGEGAAPALIAALRGFDDAEGRAELIAQIGAAGHRAALPVIESVRRASHPLLRAAALEASLRLLRGDKPALVELLRASFEDPDVHVRRRAAVAAAGCAGIELRGFLLPLLRDSDPQIRRIACASLAGDGDPATLRALLAALLDEDTLVRRTAARLLEVRLGRSLSALVDWPEPDRRRAVATLRRRVLRESASAWQQPAAASSEGRASASAADPGRERSEDGSARAVAELRASRSREPALGEAPWKS